MGGALVIDPNDELVYWFGGVHYNSEAIDSIWEMGVSKSTDGGSTWTHYTLDLADDTHPYGAYTHAIALDPSNSNVVYAGGEVIDNPALYKTTDGGENWSDIVTGVTGERVSVIVINPDNTDIVYTGTYDGVFKSTDGGATWVDIGLDSIEALVIDHDVPNIIYAGTKAGVYVSFSGGIEWEAMNDGLDTTDVRCLGLHPAVYLFCGTWGNSMYRCVPEYDDVWPPATPNITQAEKSSNNVKFTWNTVATDTLDNPEAMDYYVVYRNTSPDFIPSVSDSIAAVVSPDTEYIDEGALVTGDSYYYLIKAVDTVGHKSKISNMGYVFRKFLTENAGATSDRNWVGLPYNSEYDSIKDLTDDVSPTGTPISKTTRLDKEEQSYYSWIYHPVLGWYGNHPNPALKNFPIVLGEAYEMIAKADSVVVFVGYNDPDGGVFLNNNAGTMSDRNWVSISYNAVYDSVKDITDELSPGGDPVSKITRLAEETQSYYSWIYHPVLGWYGNHPDPVWKNFPIESGDGYEFIAKRDTTWNPIEYSNAAVIALLARRRKRMASDIEWYCGASLEPMRAPVWTLVKRMERIDYSNAQVYRPVTRHIEEKGACHEPGVSHIVHVDMALEGYEGMVFTVYRPQRPYDVLTEQSVGCAIARQGDVYRLISFDVGNFKQPWHDGEEVMLIIEALKEGRAYFSVVDFSLDAGMDIQGLSEVVFVPICESVLEKEVMKWHGIDNNTIIGYSIYRANKRLNEQVLEWGNSSRECSVHVRLVIRGGYETVYSSQVLNDSSLDSESFPTALTVSPNPFIGSTALSYYIPQSNRVELQIYDVSGRLVQSLIDEMCNPGHHMLVWDATDDAGKTVPVGIYFVRFATSDYERIEKLILLR